MTSLNQEITCLVFRTNLQNQAAVAHISEAMENIPGMEDWSVDLDNWEKVLRVVGTGISAETILNVLRAHHVKIEKMPV